MNETPEAAPANPESAVSAEPSPGGSRGPGANPEPSARRPSGDRAERKARKVREGLVVSDKMAKTVVVEAIDRVQHRRYSKTIQRTKRLLVHDEQNTLNIGDRVRVQETRPLSKNKRWRLVEILERAK